MAKIVFPSATLGENKGQISVMRRLLNEWASYLAKSPGAKTAVGVQVSAFLNAVGITPTLPTTQIIVSSGVKVTGPAITGSYVNGYTLTIVGGVITAIVAS